MSPIEKALAQRNREMARAVYGLLIIALICASITIPNL